MMDGGWWMDGEEQRGSEKREGARGGWEGEMPRTLITDT